MKKKPSNVPDSPEPTSALCEPAASDAQLPSAFGYLRGTILRQEDIVAPDLEVWGETPGSLTRSGDS
jgi:hypothetical protein